GGKMSTDISTAEHHSPPLPQAFAELVGLIQMVKHGGVKPHALRQYLIPEKPDVVIPKGTEYVAILIPGFLGPGTSMEWLAKRLSRDKVFAMTWGDHGNIGPFPHIIDPLFELIQEVSERSGKKVVLVGHSLGGTYALHANHLLPQYVQGAITLGSPIQTTIEGLAEATVLGRAASLLANEYIQQLLHDGIISSWAPEHTKPDPEGYRLAIAASLDSIVDAFACLLHESENTRNVIVKSDHVGLPSNELVARMIDAVVRSGDVHVDFGEKVNNRLLTMEDLERVNGLSSTVKVLNHMTRGHRRRMKALETLLEEVGTTGLNLVSNIPTSAFDAVGTVLREAQSAGLHLVGLPQEVLEALTRLTLDPQQAAENARRGGDVHVRQPLCVVTAGDAQSGHFPHDTGPGPRPSGGRHGLGIAS
ncbi:MAG TPA: alpha/beta hydrolase, partial [Acidimicrobiia bacterium]|nr:alpha/beta hydrolase [Acidimicrobiia bacterium]